MRAALLAVLPPLFGIALLCCGMNSTVTATLAGQIVMEGFLDIKLAPWLRRLVTRATNDVENIAEMFSSGIVALVTDDELHPERSAGFFAGGMPGAEALAVGPDHHHLHRVVAVGEGEGVVEGVQLGGVHLASESLLAFGQLSHD